MFSVFNHRSPSTSSTIFACVSEGLSTSHNWIRQYPGGHPSGRNTSLASHGIRPNSSGTYTPKPLPQRYIISISEIPWPQSHSTHKPSATLPDQNLYWILLYADPFNKALISTSLLISSTALSCFLQQAGKTISSAKSSTTWNMQQNVFHMITQSNSHKFTSINKTLFEHKLTEVMHGKRVNQHSHISCHEIFTFNWWTRILRRYWQLFDITSHQQSQFVKFAWKYMIMCACVCLWFSLKQIASNLDFTVPFQWQTDTEEPKNCSLRLNVN